MTLEENHNIHLELLSEGCHCALVGTPANHHCHAVPRQDPLHHGWWSQGLECRQWHCMPLPLPEHGALGGLLVPAPTCILYSAHFSPEILVVNIHSDQLDLTQLCSLSGGITQSCRLYVVSQSHSVNSIWSSSMETDFWWASLFSPFPTF